jgi:three-Cys-motif partner protein
VRFVPGDVNLNADAILSEMPDYGSSQTVLAFCLADPFRMSDLQFETIRALAKRCMDFLILIPTGMEATRWWEKLLRPESTIVADFTGASDWRDGWKEADRAGVTPDLFLTELYHDQMKALGYEYGGVDRTVLIKLPVRNVRLYRLAFFSRNRLGGRLWDQARRYSTEQLRLFDGPNSGGA